MVDRGSRDSRCSKPGESVETLIASEPGAADRLTDEMTWRVRFRIGPYRTDVLGVRFTRSDVTSHECRLQSDREGGLKVGALAISSAANRASFISHRGPRAAHGVSQTRTCSASATFCLDSSVGFAWIFFTRSATGFPGRQLAVRVIRGDDSGRLGSEFELIDLVEKPDQLPGAGRVRAPPRARASADNSSVVLARHAVPN